MIARASEPLKAWLICSDLVATAAAWLLADLIRLRSGLIPILAPDYPEFALCVRQIPFVLLLALVAFRVAGMYDITRLRRFREDIHGVLKGVALMALLVICLTFVIQSPYRPRGVLALFPFLAGIGILISRRASWQLLGHFRRRGWNQSHALIIGTGRLARQTARMLENAPAMGIQVVAHVDDNHSPQCDKPVTGPIAELPRLVQELHIEHVFIALPMNRYAEVRRVFDLLSQCIVEVRLVADVPAMASLSLTTTRLHGTTIIGLRESGFYGINVIVKRVMDVVLASLGLLIAAPLMVLIAAAIKMTSRGPVFYRQERCSFNGEPFLMLKFRTMRADAEKNTGPVWAERDDPRRTWFGAFLRATNLDELPQLFNVLRGEMSLVGPRPERPIFINRFKSTIPNYMARHAAKCGMTGWAQVNGWRGNTSLRRRVQFDLFYITHWNPLFDLRILFLTVLRMLLGRQRNAY